MWRSSSHSLTTRTTTVSLDAADAVELTEILDLFMERLEVLVERRLRHARLE